MSVHGPLFEWSAGESTRAMRTEGSRPWHCESGTGVRRLLERRGRLASAAERLIRSSRVRFVIVEYAVSTSIAGK